MHSTLNPSLGPGVVYLVTCECKHDGYPIKIGYSHYRSLYHRLVGIQTGNHHKVEFYRIILNVRVEGEKWMKERYAHLLIRGEWFTFDPEMATVQIPNEFADRPYSSQGIVDLSKDSYPGPTPKIVKPKKLAPKNYRREVRKQINSMLNSIKDEQ